MEAALLVMRLARLVRPAPASRTFVFIGKRGRRADLAPDACVAFDESIVNKGGSGDGGISGLFQPVLFDLVLEGSSFDTKVFGGFCFVPVESFEGASDEFSFEVVGAVEE